MRRAVMPGHQGCTWPRTALKKFAGSSREQEPLVAESGVVKEIDKIKEFVPVK
jgi:hypothetical protein